LPAATLGDKTAAVISVAVCNLRTKPAHAAEMASQGLLGFPVKVLRKTDNGWFLVQTPDEYIAWVDSDALQTMNEAALRSWTSAKKVMVTADFTFTLAAAERNAARVADVTKGNVLKFVSKSSTFYTVEYPDGQTAYLPLEHGVEWESWMQNVKAFATDPAKLVETAKLCMGIPYLWGGTSMKGMDCSGFTRTVYMQHGVLLPRDASQQALIGDAVSIEAVSGETTRSNASGSASSSAGALNFWSTLKTGDLLFFGRKATDSTRELVTHVGMYVANGEYIHEAGKVRFNSFDPKAKNYSEARVLSLLRARRVLGASSRGSIRTIEEVFAK
jgi:gamma-D-glutamyl-L-lysine dipeptidyl-peptidase